jgi:hypothetical protein
MNDLQFAWKIPVSADKMFWTSDKPAKCLHVTCPVIVERGTCQHVVSDASRIGLILTS